MTKKSNVDAQLDLLLQKIYTEKLFEFDQTDFGSRLDQLIEKGLVKISNGKICLLDLTNLSKQILSRLKKDYHFNGTNDTKQTASFIRKALKHFDSDGFVSGKHEFEIALAGQFLIEFNKIYKGSILELIMAFEKDDEYFFDIEEACCAVLPELNIETKDLIDIIDYLAKQVEAEDVFINLDVERIGNAVHRLCKTDTEKGKELLEYCILSGNKHIPKFHGNILCGLLEADHSFLDEIEKLILRPEAQIAAIASLQAKFSIQTPYKRLVSIAESIPFPTAHYQLQLPRFYRNIITAEDNDDENLINHCFDRIAELIASGNQEVIMQFFFQFRFLKGYDTVISTLLLNFIGSKHFDKNHCKLVMGMFKLNEDFGGLFKTFKAMILKLGSKFSTGSVSNEMILARSRNKPEFDKGLISVLIDDNGLVRTMSGRLLMKLGIGHHITGFQCNILTLSALDQYKLCLSLLEDFHEPKDIFPYIIPLFDSSYDLVKELTIHKVEIMAENYGSSVVKHIEDSLDALNPNHAEIIGRINLHYQEFNKQLEKKRGIKELNPYYTHYQYIKQFNELKDKEMRKSFDQAPKIDFLPGDPIQLLKGGGWKSGDDSKVNQLSTFESSMQLPREYLIAPELFDYEGMHAINENWKNKFDKWAATISL